MSPSRKKHASGGRSAKGDEPRRDDDAREARAASGGGGATRSTKRAPQQRTSYSDRGGQQEPQRGQRSAPEQTEREGEYPKPPLPKQHQQSPGLESRVTPRPKFEAPAYKAAGKLQGKAALVTGGDSGIGRAVALLYAREGADVAIVFLPEEQSDAEETRRHVEAEGRKCVLLAGDVSDAAFCREAVSRAVRELGRLDVLVNNAAYQHNVKSLGEISDEQWDRTFRTNIYGYFYMAKAALEHMGEGSAIVNTGSITGLQGSKDLLDYSSTKGAIHAFTKSLAQNLVERKIRVNCVAPGPVWTPLNPSAKPAEDVAKFGEDTPMKRPAQPEEIAPAFVFFASNADSSYITGEVLTLLGGETTAA